MKKKTITLKKTGYQIEGTAHLKLWGGGESDIDMYSRQIKGRLTKQKLLDCINDSGFGCEQIISANLRIYELYENGYTLFLDNITINSKHCEQGSRGI